MRRRDCRFGKRTQADEKASERARRELAGNIQRRLVEALGTLDRGCKVRKDLAVLQCTTMPATLVEVGFIDNDDDFEILMHRQNEIAYAIVCGVKDYFLL